jgi:hypothetical protein
MAAQDSRLVVDKGTLIGFRSQHPSTIIILFENASVLLLCQSCSDVFRADLLPCGLAAGGGGGEAVPGDIDGAGA